MQELPVSKNIREDYTEMHFEINILIEKFNRLLTKADTADAIDPSILGRRNFN